MLLDILRMPPVFGIPINRSQTIYTDNETDCNDAHAITWSGIPLCRSKLNVGGVVNKTPQRLYKAVHISHDDDWIFETVFSMEGTVAVCLYTKIINSLNSHIGISLKGIQHYHYQHSKPIPVAHFLDHHHPAFNGDQPGVPEASKGVNNIVPAIFNEYQLWMTLNQFYQCAGSGLIDSRLAWSYSPIYTYLPHVMDALITGQFAKSPMMELVEHHPHIALNNDKWFVYEELVSTMDVRGFEGHINHPAFDSQALKLILLMPVKYSLQISLCDALERTRKFSYVYAFDNAYGPALGVSSDNNQEALLVDVIYDCVMAYCNLYHIDYYQFIKHNSPLASISIRKNIHDEVAIIINDTLSSRYECFYFSFPALALATLAVGYDHG